MKDNYHQVRVGVLYWEKGHGMTEITSNGLKELGCNVVDFSIGDDIPHGTDVVFVLGPNGSLVPVLNQFIALNSKSRPILLFHHTEPFPNPALPEWVRMLLGYLRSGLERNGYRRIEKGTSVEALGWKWITSRGYRFRYYGDLHWIKQSGIKYLLSVDSPLTEDFFRSREFKVITANGFWFPNNPEWGADLYLERDIPVLWMGKFGSSRRKLILNHLRSELRARDVKMMCIDGVENPYVFGKLRTLLINRSKIVLNILRQEWDNNAMRFYLAAFNRALVITETMLPHNPAFINGKHLIEAPIDKLADTIVYYLSHDSERQRITDEANKLVTEEITLQGTLGRILDTALEQKFI